MIEVVRSEEEYRALADAALDRELERARAGLTPSVSSKAAARFLGVHFDTLGEWRRRSPPLGPPFQKGAGGVGIGSNQHVRYLYADLVEWQAARTGKTVKERRLLDELERLKQKARELEIELELQSIRDHLARMTKKAGRILALETAKECLETGHDWVVVDGVVIGHVLTAPETILDGALKTGSVLHATLSEVLAWPWTNSATRDEFSAQLNTALVTLMSQLQAERSLQRSRDLDAEFLE
jgi:hypothetical protein